MEQQRQTSELAVRGDTAPIEWSGGVGRMMPISALQVYNLATSMHRAGLSRNGLETPEKITVAILKGVSLGMDVMQSIDNIAVINGRPTVYSDGVLALIRATGLLEAYRQEYEGEGDEFGCIVSGRRKDSGETLTTKFTVADAKAARLWGKGGPWSLYPKRMLMFRARGFWARDLFPDVLMGMVTAEEAMDYPEAAVVSSVADVKPGSGDLRKLTGMLPNPKPSMPKPEPQTEPEPDSVFDPEPEVVVEGGGYEPEHDQQPPFDVEPSEGGTDWTKADNTPSPKGKQDSEAVAVMNLACRKWMEQRGLQKPEAGKALRRALLDLDHWDGQSNYDKAEMDKMYGRMFAKDFNYARYETGLVEGE
jgi:hypothetical protein